VCEVLADTDALEEDFVDGGGDAGGGGLEFEVGVDAGREFE
jgi:hypothetical protein